MFNSYNSIRFICACGGGVTFKIHFWDSNPLKEAQVLSS